MKKLLVACTLILAMTIMAGTLALGAVGSIVPTNYSEYGQKTLSVYTGGAAPSTDGVVADGEYYNTLGFSSSTAGVSFSSDTFTGYPNDVKVGITTDNEFIYLGITVSEPYYKYRVGTTSGSYMAFSLGFNMGDTFYQCMDRQTLTLSVYDDKTSFYANTIMAYNSSGTPTTTYNANIYAASAFTRDETNKLTTYEVKLSRAELAVNAGLTALPETCYIHFLNKTFDSAGNNGEFRYRCILDETTKAIITAQDGWCASFAPHLISFLAPGTETTAEPATVTTVAPVTTPAPVTTAAPVTTVKETEAAITSTAAPETSAAPADETTATATTAVPQKGGCGSLAALAVIPLIFSVIPVIRRKK